VAIFAQDFPHVGYLIKELRESRGWSLRQLADKADISAAELSRIENGKRQRPSRDTLNRLASCLRVEPEMLLKAAGYRIIEQQDVDPEGYLYLGFRGLGYDEREAQTFTKAFLTASPNFGQADDRSGKGHFLPILLHTLFISCSEQTA